jgi:peptidyl-prolyl cis-trans isomerase B (cyclophilin B)
MPSADKRARKKENARAAREEREAALRRKKRTRSTITIAVVVAIFAGVIILLNVTGGDKKKPAAAATSTSTTPTTVDRSMKYTATITTNFGPIKLALDVKNAPIAASHFIDLARKGVYDGSRWHRILTGFVVQGGAPGGDPLKDYGHPVVGEIPKGTYKLYDVAAAKKSTDPAGTFDSQFFIITGAQGQALPHDYTDFAHVTSGLDVVTKLLALKVDGNGDPKGLPSQKATIDKVTISVS